MSWNRFDVGNFFFTRRAQLFYTFRQLSNGWSFKQRTQRKLYTERLPDAGNNLGRKQRVSAESKELIVRANFFQAQHLGPNCSKLLFGRIPWRNILFGLSDILGDGQ